MFTEVTITRVDDDDDDDASMCVHGDDFMVESRIDVVKDAKAMSEHNVDRT